MPRLEYRALHRGVSPLSYTLYIVQMMVRACACVCVRVCVCVCVVCGVVCVVHDCCCITIAEGWWLFVTRPFYRAFISMDVRPWSLGEMSDGVKWWTPCYRDELISSL